MNNIKYLKPYVKQYLFLMISFFCICCDASFHENENIQVGSIQRLNIAPYLKVVFDKEDKTVDEIALSISEAPLNHQTIIKADYQSGYIWLGGSLNNANNTSVSLYLEISPVFVEHFQIFVRRDDNTIDSFQYEYKQPRIINQIISRRPTLHFTLPPQTKSEIIIKYKPILRNDRVLVFSVDLYNDLQYQYYHSLNLGLLSALFGGLILAAFFCGVAYYQVGLKPYLNFQLFIFSVLITLFCFEGLIHYLPINYFPNDIIMIGKIASYSMGIFLIQLGLGLVYEPGNKSRGEAALRKLTWLLWLGLIPVYFGHVRFIFDIATLAVMMLLVVLSLNIAYKQRKAHLLFFATGMGIQISAMLSFSLLDNLNPAIFYSLGQPINVLEFKRVVFHVGTLLNIMFMAVAINVQVKNIKKQRDQAENTEQELQNRYREELELAVALRTEKINQQTIELKSLDAAKSKFFASISHEFRTPISLISGPTELLLNGAYGQLSEPVEEQLNFIDRNSKRLKQFVDQILDLTIFEANKFELIMEYVEIKPWLQEKISAFNSVAVTQHKKLHLRVRQNSIARIDTNNFEKVIYNLLSNAIKFSDPKSSIYVDAGIDEAGIYISVRDDGIGMTDEMQRQCFEMFKKAPGNTNNEEGCGIGLALAKEIVEQHNGRIDVVSKQGAGSTFRISVPQVSEELPEMVAVTEAEHEEVLIRQPLVRQGITHQAEAATVLVVEDNEDMLRFIQSGLNRNYKIMTASNGEQALEMLRDNVPDIIIADLSMPKMNGLELLVEIRADANFCDLPVVMLTGAANTNDQQAAFTSMADDYVTKPFDMEDLKLRLDSILRIRLLIKSKYGEGKSLTAPQKEPEFVVKARQLMDKNISDPSFDSNELAKHLFMTSKTLGRRLDKAIGMTPGVFIRTIRLEAARTFIVEKNYSSKKQLAQSVGFSSPAYFARLIRSHYPELSDF